MPEQWRRRRFASVARFLAATPSRLVVVSIEDVLGVLDQPNLPGTIDEHPELAATTTAALEDWAGHQKLHALARVFQNAGRGSGKSSG